MQPEVATIDPLSSVRNGVFVADLHLLSPRSIGQGAVSELSRLSHDRDCIVLGGDIFDFRWSRQGSHRATLEAARRWLEELVAGTANTHIIYLPGNHDCHPDFLEVLETLAQSVDRFTWAEHYVQISDCLFLHGDVLDAGNVERLAAYRQKFHHELPQSALAHRSYDMAVSMRIHKLVPLLRHQPVRTCQRLLATLQELPLTSAASLRRIYFGHTHVPIRGMKIDEVAFYNPGASLRHMAMHIEKFEI